MSKYEPTNLEIHATETYKQAKETAELIPIPHYSIEVQGYEQILSDYREVCADLNSSGFGRFSTNPADKDQGFSDNLIVFTNIESNLNKARTLHAKIVECIKAGIADQKQAEWEAIWNARRQQDTITLNAFLVAKDRLTQENKNKAKAERLQAKKA